MNYNMKKAKCKVWEIENPKNWWYETFNVYELKNIDDIFRAFNSSLRPNEKARTYEFIEYEQ